MFFLILLFKVLILKKIPTYNVQMKKGAISFFPVAAFFFYLGLDENNDYLRFYHGMWHFTVSLWGYYLYIIL